MKKECLEKMKTVDICYSFDILLMDSGLKESPQGWNCFEPKEGDMAYVSSENKYYEFKSGSWIAR